MIDQFRENLPVTNYQFSTVNLMYGTADYSRAYTVLETSTKSYISLKNQYRAQFESGDIGDIKIFSKKINDHDLQQNSVFSFLADKRLNKVVATVSKNETTEDINWQIIGLDEHGRVLENDPIDDQKRNFQTDNLQIALTILEKVEQARLIAKGYSHNYNYMHLEGYDQSHFGKTLYDLRKVKDRAPDGMRPKI